MRAESACHDGIDVQLASDLLRKERRLPEMEDGASRDPPGAAPQDGLRFSEHLAFDSSAGVARKLESGAAAIARSSDSAAGVTLNTDGRN